MTVDGGAAPCVSGRQPCWWLMMWNVGGWSCSSTKSSCGNPWFDDTWCGALGKACWLWERRDSGVLDGQVRQILLHGSECTTAGGTYSHGGGHWVSWCSVWLGLCCLLLLLCFFQFLFNLPSFCTGLAPHKRTVGGNLSRFFQARCLPVTQPILSEQWIERNSNHWRTK